MPTRWSRACGALLGLAFYTLDRAHRRIAERNLAAAFPARPAAERRAIVRGAFAHFGRLLFELLKFSTLSPAAMLARVEFDGEERVAARPTRRARACCSSPATSASGSCRRWCTRCGSSRSAVLARALDNPQLNQLLERDPHSAPATRVIYRQGTIRRVMRTLQAGQGVARADRSAHHEPRRDLRGLLRAAGGDDVGGGGAGAAHRRAGGAGVRAAARRRPLPDDLRAPGRAAARRRRAMPIREFTQRCTDVLEMYVRRHPELWLWMHRRWRDEARRERRGARMPRRCGRVGAGRCESCERPA